MGDLKSLELSKRRTWPLVPPAPIVVALLGLAVALVTFLLGYQRLAASSEEGAAERARLLSLTIGARLSALDVESRRALLDRASRRASANLWLIDGSGVLIEESLGTSNPMPLPESKARSFGSGELVTSRGNARFHVVEVAGFDVSRAPGTLLPPRHSRSLPPANSSGLSPNSNSSAVKIGDKDGKTLLVSAVEIPDAPEGVGDLVTTLLTLTLLLTGVACGVAIAVARDVRVDVDELGIRVREIALRGRERSDRAQDVVPVGSLDEVGELAAAFNGLVERFADAERAYSVSLARIEEIDRERATFLATVSHELRSPLNAILGFADILLSEVDGPLRDESREEVAIIKQSGLHLLSLINDILELSAIASGQLKLTRSDVDLGPIAEEVAKEAVGSLGDKPVVIRVTYVGVQRPILAYVDGKRIRQVLTNLVGNAVKFTREGEIVIDLDEDAHAARVTVRDTGPGIAPGERAHIFDEYRQGGDARSRRRGTGLGLSIARRLVFAHGGSLALEAQSGIGSTFALRLPRGRGNSLIQVELTDLGYDTLPRIRTSQLTSARESAASGKSQ